MLDREQKLVLSITRDDIIALSSDMVVIEEENAQDSLLDEHARALKTFYSHGYEIYPFSTISSLEKRKKVSVAGVVWDDPRTGDYTRKDGKEARFLAIPLADGTGSMDLMVWSDSEIDYLESLEIKRDDILFVIGVKHNKGRQGAHLTLAQPHVVKVNPAGLTSDDFRKKH